MIGVLLLGGPMHGQAWMLEGNSPPGAIEVVQPPRFDWRIYAEPDDEALVAEFGFYRCHRMVEPIGVIGFEGVGVKWAWWQWWIASWWMDEEQRALIEYQALLRLAQVIAPRGDNLFHPPPAGLPVDLQTDVRMLADLYHLGGRRSPAVNTLPPTGRMYPRDPVFYEPVNWQAVARRIDAMNRFH